MRKGVQRGSLTLALTLGRNMSLFDLLESLDVLPLTSFL